MIRLIILILVLTHQHAFGLELPETMEDRMIYDFAEVLTTEEELKLESKLVKFRADHGQEIILVLTKDEVSEKGDEFAASVANKRHFDPNTMVISADVQHNVYGFYVRDPLKKKFPQWVVEKIEYNNIKENFRSKEYYLGLKEATDNVIGITLGIVSAEDLKKHSSNKGIILLIVSVAFFILIFPIIQFVEMKKSYFTSRPLDFVGSVLSLNHYGTRGKNVFDNFSHEHSGFTAPPSKARQFLAGGHGVAGYW